MFELALTRLALTARGHDRVLRVARTIADLEGCDGVKADHVGEALQFRGD
jgi:magnesium chelatase family protein